MPKFYKKKHDQLPQTHNQREINWTFVVLYTTLPCFPSPSMQETTTVNQKNSPQHQCQGNRKISSPSWMFSLIVAIVVFIAYFLGLTFVPSNNLNSSFTSCSPSSSSSSSLAIVFSSQSCSFLIDSEDYDKLVFQKLKSSL